MHFSPNGLCYSIASCEFKVFTNVRILDLNHSYRMLSILYRFSASRTNVCNSISVRAFSAMYIRVPRGVQLNAHHCSGERLSALGLAHPIELNREIGMGWSNPFAIVALYSRGWVKFDSKSAELDEELLDLYGISLPGNR